MPLEFTALRHFLAILHPAGRSFYDKKIKENHNFKNHRFSETRKLTLQCNVEPDHFFSWWPSQERLWEMSVNELKQSTLSSFLLEDSNYPDGLTLVFEGGVRAPPAKTYLAEPAVEVSVVDELKALVFDFCDYGSVYFPCGLRMEGENDSLVQVFGDENNKPTLPQKAI